MVYVHYCRVHCKRFRRTSHGRWSIWCFLGQGLVPPNGEVFFSQRKKEFGRPNNLATTSVFFVVRIFLATKKKAWKPRWKHRGIWRPTITRPGPPKGVAFLEGKSPLSESAGAPPGNATPPYYWKDYSPPSNLLITPLQKALFLRGGLFLGGYAWTTMNRPGFSFGAPNLGNVGNEALVASNSGAWQVTVALMEAAERRKNWGKVN